MVKQRNRLNPVCVQLNREINDKAKKKLTEGGTILGTSRIPFKYINEPDKEGRDKIASMIKTYKELKLDCLVMLGENGSHKTGWLTLHAGIAGGADIILIPEIPYNVDGVVKTIKMREKQGKKSTIIAMAEGAVSQEDIKLSKKEYGNMVCIKEGRFSKVPFEEVAGKTKMVDTDNELVRQAELLGISLGRKA